MGCFIGHQQNNPSQLGLQRSLQGKRSRTLDPAELPFLDKTPLTEIAPVAPRLPEPPVRPECAPEIRIPLDLREQHCSILGHTDDCRQRDCQLCRSCHILLQLPPWRKTILFVIHKKTISHSACFVNRFRLSGVFFCIKWLNYAKNPVSYRCHRI